MHLQCRRAADCQVTGAESTIRLQTAHVQAIAHHANCLNSLTHRMSLVQRQFYNMESLLDQRLRDKKSLADHIHNCEKMLRDAGLDPPLRSAEVNCIKNSPCAYTSFVHYVVSQQP